MNAMPGMTATPRPLLPAAAGLPFRRAHRPEIEARGGGAAWFQVHAENYMGEGGQP